MYFQFVGVVVENFHKCKETLEAEMKAKAKQKRMERRLKHQQQFEELLDSTEIEPKTDESVEPSKNPYWDEYGPFRLYIHNIVVSKYFDLAIAGVIGINVFSMSMVTLVFDYSLHRKRRIECV